MKVSKIVSQIKEYERLQGLISNIESALENLGKPKDEPEKYSFGGIVSIGFKIEGEKQTSIDVHLNPGVSELISSDLETVLKKHLSSLKENQVSLEI